MNTLKPDLEECSYLIALSLVPKIGSKKANLLLQHYGNAKNLFEAFESDNIGLEVHLHKDSVQIIRQKSTLEKAHKIIERAQKEGYDIICQQNKRYPKRLKHQSDAPVVLYYRGNSPLNASKVVAIVGTRKPTTNGRILCERLVEELQQYNVCIVSGLAYGIDVTAHLKCLQLNMPTIGVVAHGLDMMYPLAHQKTAKRMLQNGALISEHPFGTKALPQHFPMRNRIIAGMSDALVVVETAIKGGSMITAQFANSYSKDVFAFPGRTNDQLSKGCNHLIKTHKAALLEGAKDIAYHLRWQQQKSGSQKTLFNNLSNNEQYIVDMLVGESAVHIDQLLKHSNLGISTMASILLELEMKGIVRPLAGKNYRLQ